jgi:hypothetical protein
MLLLDRGASITTRNDVRTHIHNGETGSLIASYDCSFHCV